MDKVIKVSTNEYYACVNGIWFVGSSPNGPWKTAEKIPSAIYSIPPSSPVYNVTYVKQTVVNNTYVTSSYTSGYMGVYLAPTPYGVVVISGTGYYHPPYYYYPPYGYPVCMNSKKRLFTGNNPGLLKVQLIRQTGILTITYCCLS